MIPGIVASGLASGVVPPDTDPLWDDVVLCINGVGSDGSTSYYDAKGHSISAVGSVLIEADDPDFPSGGIRISPSSFLYLADSSDFDFPGDVTVEFDYKPITKATSYPAPLSLYNSFGANGGFTFFDRHASSPTSFCLGLNGGFPVLDAPAFSNGNKYRVRLVRQGSGADNLKLYINGALANQTTFTSQLNSVNGIWIGTSGDLPEGAEIDGIMGRIRITAAARTEPQGTAPFPES